jgi:hypothetical protein
VVNELLELRDHLLLLTIQRRDLRAIAVKQRQAQLRRCIMPLATVAVSHGREAWSDRLAVRQLLAQP